jgi:hypothetical protein
LIGQNEKAFSAKAQREAKQEMQKMTKNESPSLRPFLFHFAPLR